MTPTSGRNAESLQLYLYLRRAMDMGNIVRPISVVVFGTLFYAIPAIGAGNLADPESFFQERCAPCAEVRAVFREIREFVSVAEFAGVARIFADGSQCNRGNLSQPSNDLFCA